ncbi:SRPBCC family protein [Streptomyces sp. NPDC053755]|uniref:SRPBCC family protein n=1 Tax=Streptomyces sp. NPDC053755 TaxID=3155815 RepID=UPI00344585DB
MEHEVFVPVPAEVLRETLTDPARVARCVPGLQQDADAEAGPLSGRLKVRAGGHTITYRGALRLTERDGVLSVDGEGTEVRGKGSAKLSLTLRLTPVKDGTSLAFSGTLTADGRLAELSEETRASAGARLCDRLAESLTAAAVAHLRTDAATDETDADLEADEDADAAEAAPAGSGARPDLSGPDAEDEADSDSDGVDDGVEEPHRPSVYDTPVPPPSLDPLLGDDFEDAPVEYPAEPAAAEAAHARRTMIGRSAEEVDHAPPRGRYAPVPAPDSSSAGATLRWLAPAAALALASAVVVGRALRRRH